jgi:uncharacterized membrane protein YkvA (DUF1232 family)
MGLRERVSGYEHELPAQRRREAPQGREEVAMTGRRSAAYAAAAAAAAAEGPTGFGSRIALIPRMVRDVLTGRYDGMSRGRLLVMVLAALYIVSPVDLMPEALLTIPGLADDAAVGAWLIASLLGATTAYRAWTNGRVQADPHVTVIQGEVIRD